MARQFLAPQTGKAFKLKNGQHLKVIDPNGQQVSDLFCFDVESPSDVLSAGRTIDYNDTIYIKPGHFLYSNAGKPMFEVLEDTCGRHDLLVTPCSLQMFQMVAKNNDYHPSCHENLSKALSEYGVTADDITSTFNIFMNITVAPESGRISIEAPLSKAEDYILLRACRDLVVGLTACSDEGTNNGRCKSIEYEVYQ